MPSFIAVNADMEIRLGAPDTSSFATISSSSVTEDRFDAVNLKVRVLSAAVLIPLAVLAIYVGGLAYDAMVALFLALGMSEWLRLVAPAARRYVKASAFGALFAILACCVTYSAEVGFVLSLISISLLFPLAAWRDKAAAPWVVLGIPYLAWSGLALIAVMATPNIGRELTVFLIGVVSATDIGAYFAGRMIGGPKLMPNISPKKTWAGLFGGMAFAAILGYGVAVGLGAARPVVALMLALSLALVSQVGDLFESYVKRRSGVKDSGNIIPGHGGVLDRIDGLLFAAVFFEMFNVMVGDGLRWW